MKLIKNIFLSTAVLALLVLSGCKKDDPKPSDKEVLQDALTSTNWTIDPANSDVSGVTGKPDVSTTTITFIATDPGASFTFGGDIAVAVMGGTFDIADNGATSALDLSVSSDIVVTSASLDEVTDARIKMSITTGKAGGRLDGVGSYTLTFNAN